MDYLRRISFGKMGIIPFLGLCLCSVQVQASVSFNVSAERLQDPSGIDMAVTGILVLVADSNGDGFGGPSSSAFVTGDDYEVKKWDIATDGGNTPGVFHGTTGSVPFFGAWGEGDPLAIYWFPTLNVSSEAPGEAIPYGMFTGGSLDGTDPWTTPADGTSGHQLIFLTTDADTLLPSGGSSNSASGLASNVTSGATPTTPSSLAGVTAQGGITLTWTDESGDETGFRIERSVDGSGVWELAGAVGPGITTFLDTTATSAMNYLYRVRAVRNASWSMPSASAQVGASLNRVRFFNLSNRAIVRAGDERLIGSATAVGESGSQVEVLVVVRGPSLAPSLPNYTGNLLADPMITLVNLATREEVTNDDFNDWNNGEIETRFAGFITDPKESGIIFTMDAGQGYSAIVAGVGGSAGLANIEFYEIGGTGARLRNLSNRAWVGTGDERLIGSARAVDDSSATQVEVLVVVRGPSLASNLPNYTGGLLTDPMITLVDLATNLQITNDDFGDWNNGEIETRFAGFITNPKESGAIFTLDSNQTYSVVVEGVGGGTGLANIEFYEILPANASSSTTLPQNDVSPSVDPGDDVSVVNPGDVTDSESPLQPVSVGTGPGQGGYSFTLNSATVSGDILNIDVSYSGGVKQHVFTLSTAESFQEADPVRLDLFLTHNTADGQADLAEAWLTEQLRFDLTAIKTSYKQQYQKESGTIQLMLDLPNADDLSIDYTF